MRDVFISYARDDRDHAARLASALEARGLSVWWDREIPPGRTFDEVIEEALTSARCVFVLWSESSVRSRWVRAEASAASERGVLVPVLVEAVEPPLEFRSIQAADLTGWDGADDHPEWERLFATVSAMGRTDADVPIPRRRPSPPMAGRVQPLAIAVVSLTVGAGLSYLLFTRPAANRNDSSATNSTASPTASSASVSETASVARPAAPPAAARNTTPDSGRTDLLAAANGGHLVRAPHENWMEPIDGTEAWGYITGAEAVYAFKDDKPATFDVFRMLITETRGYNIKSFELLAASDAPNGQFQSLGTFETQNVRLFPSPWQDFTFAPVQARYLKVRVRSLHSPSGPTQVEQWQLLGRF
jgi:hypothetical protein